MKLETPEAANVEVAGLQWGGVVGVAVRTRLGPAGSRMGQDSSEARFFFFKPTIL